MTVHSSISDASLRTNACDDVSINAGNDLNLAAFFRTLARGQEGQVWDTEEYFGYLSGVRHALFNGIVAARLPEADLERRAATILRPFREGQVPALWWTGPASSPPSLGEVLERLGLQERDPAPIMGRPLDTLPDVPPPHPDLDVVRVDDTDRLRTYSEVWAEVYGFHAHLLPSIVTYMGCALATNSPMRHYVAYWRGEAVGTSTLQCGGGVAGLYNVATREAARGRGVGTALTLRVLEEARLLGYHVIILQASEMGLPIYERLGFRTAGRLVQYLLLP